MKKTLVTAITTALVVGAASTTFAAANPFSDVPRDNWAYDAVAKLAQDGVVNGYGDGSFRGDNTITRYEMAQIVAKAMAKNDVSAADKATIDKLAAEYADELNNLGVRVDNLEKKTDNVKFVGEARYTYTSDRHAGEDKVNYNEMLFRLEPTAQINENWVAKARMDWSSNLAKDTSANTTDVSRVYVEGKLFGADAKLGKLPTYSAQGMIIDDSLSGGEFIFGNKLKTTLTVGKYSYNIATKAESDAGNTVGGTGTYTAVQFDYPATDKIALTASYNRLKSDDLKAQVGTDKVSLWSVGGSYKFSDTLALNGLYVKNTEDTTQNQTKAGNVQLSYKGTDASKAGSFGIYAAYRHIGQNATLDPTYDGVSTGQKGYEIGGNYAFYKNIVGSVLYFDGKDLTTDNDASKVFGRVDFFF